MDTSTASQEIRVLSVTLVPTMGLLLAAIMEPLLMEIMVLPLEAVEDLLIQETMDLPSEELINATLGTSAMTIFKEEVPTSMTRDLDSMIPTHAVETKAIFRPILETLVTTMT